MLEDCHLEKYTQNGYVHNTLRFLWHVNIMAIQCSDQTYTAVLVITLT